MTSKILKYIKYACVAGGLFLALCAVLLAYMLQPDSGGSKSCYQLTGIAPESYGGVFCPELSFPTFTYSRYRFRMDPFMFGRFKKDMTMRYGCSWAEGSEYRSGSFPGMEVISDFGSFTYYKYKDKERSVWVHYDPEIETLYIGVFNY